MDKSLQDVLEKNYPFEIVRVELIRDLIGSIYKIETSEGPYCLKLHRPHQTEEAKRGAAVQSHLQSKGVFVPRIIPTSLGQMHFMHGGRTGVLMEYVEGDAVDVKRHRDLALAEHARMQKAMEDYPHALPKKRFGYYAGRYLDYMEATGFPKAKTKTLRSHAKDFYGHLNKLPPGFSHGDYHNGNMVLRDGRVVILDFDACNDFSPDVDIVTFLDHTDFNAFSEAGIEKTIEALKETFDPEDERLMALLAYLPIRHMEIIMNIYEAEEKRDTDHAFHLQQYHWICDFHAYWTRRFI